MTIPPHRLIEKLYNRESVPLHSVTGVFERRLTATEAMSLACSGLVEGVVKNSSGILRSIRWLKATAMPSARLPTAGKPKLESYEELIAKSGSTAFARVNLGVYQQALSQVTVADGYNGRTVVSQGDVVAHCYAFSILRSQEREECLAGL
jgi:hypothetical protein